MNEKAANDFIFLTDLSYDYGLIDKTIYIERMVNLYELTDVDPEFIKDIIPTYGQSFYSFLVENYDRDDNENQDHYEEGSFGVTEQRTMLDNTVLKLYKTNSSGKECQWEFYKKDADPHPSVPHGHGVQKTKLRLDPYKGIIYEKQNRLNCFGVEKKKFIKVLWNDDNFRDYALRAIRNFITSGVVGENYNWYGIRGIKNPYRLPRKRK